MLALVVFTLGCSVDAGRLWCHLRRPWAMLLGTLCQFGIMPLTAFLLATAFRLEPVRAVAVLIMGCCPGGTISNIITYWMDGDMDLSITMTTWSTLLGLGMMPVCLYMYSGSWVGSGTIRIPYHNIGITLVTLVVPVGCGVLVNYRWPKSARLILKVGSVVGGLLILVVGVAGAVMYRGSWHTDTRVLIIGATFPAIGYAAGFTMATAVRLPWRRCRTVAMETGAQNVQICATVLQLSFPPEQLAHMFTFPLIYGASQLVDGLLLVAVYQIYKWTRVCPSSEVASTGLDLQNHPSGPSPTGEANAAFEMDQAIPATGQMGEPVPDRQATDEHNQI